MFHYNDAPLKFPSSTARPLRHVHSQPQLNVLRSPRKYFKPDQQAPETFPCEFTNAPTRVLPTVPVSMFMTRRTSQTSTTTTTPPATRRHHPHILRRQPQSDLSYRFQRVQQAEATASSAGRVVEAIPEAYSIDPVYLALKQATGRYGGGSRRSSTSNFDSSTPSPRNLSQGSLLDSGYADVVYRGNTMGSTPQLDSTEMGPNGSGRRRAPKLNKQMKSLSLDCAEKPPASAPIRSRPPRATGSSDISEWERSCSPATPQWPGIRSANSQQRLLFKDTTTRAGAAADHVVIHEYQPLVLGDRIFVMDNGDPDWLHGFRIDDSGGETLLQFPATCVAKVKHGEQPMKITQNVHIPECRLRLYRDQVVFAQPDSITDNGKVRVRTEHNAFVFCPLQHVVLL